MLRLYNTATRKVEPFEPIDPPKVGLYTCGPTVYNYAHVGNLRTYVFEDVLKRALGLCGYEVHHVMNVTDVGHLVSDADEGEDKMVLAMRREGRGAGDISQFYWDAFREDLRRLKILQPDVWCKATDHIDDQIEMVEALEAKGYTYEIEGDGVYFDTSKFPDYGKMARLDLAGLQHGARIAVHEGKRNPTDFALWKFSPTDQKRLMEWDSPWGVGFPGWHIECSAMAIRHFGKRLDIHCGGIDHIPVHHTNEIAQAECVLGHKWVNWWMHGEFLTFPKGADGEAAKMSKSSGEFLTLNLLVEKGYDPLAYRYFLLTAHYRQQLAFTWEALDGAQNAMKALKQRVLLLRTRCEDAIASPAGEKPPPAPLPLEEPIARFREAVENDLNMPQALAIMWGLLRQETDTAGWVDERVYATLLEMDEVLGLGFEHMEPEEQALTRKQREDIVSIATKFLAPHNVPAFAADLQRHIDEANVESVLDGLIQRRSRARQERDFAVADEIRGKLSEIGIILEDGPGGTTWRRA